VFEYVDGGNLLEFFKNTPPPTSPQDKHDFWTSYKGIFEGAHRIHQLTTYHDHNNRYCIVHQDIKPENILLKRAGETSMYRFQAKIADFGYSHIRSVNSDGCDKLGLDRQGSQMYSAPECSHHEPYLQRGTNRITEQADIFSLGCVTSDAAAWVVSGHDGRMAYHQNRLAETDIIDSFKGSGYGGCFHNGVGMLNAVQNMHRAIKSLVPHDQITSGIIDIVETDMLNRQPHERLPARQLKEKFGHILNGYIYTQTGPSYQSSWNPPCRAPGLERLESDEPVIQATEPPFSPVDLQTTPTRPSSSPFPSRPVNSPLSPQLTPDTDRTRRRKPYKSSSNVGRLKRSISSFKKSLNIRNSLNRTDSTASSHPSSSEPPTLTLEEVVNWREDKKASRNVDPLVDSRIRSLQSQLNGRDHLFFIDDSATMNKMSPEILKAFETMSYLAKSIDPDALELSFASKPTKLIRNTATTPLVNALSSHQYSTQSTLMEQSMDQYVDNVLMPRLANWLRGRTSLVPAKLISVFVFTDGAWGQNREKAAGVQKPITRLMNLIEERKLSRTQVMIQFVRFGNDSDGHRYLNYLDVFGKEKDW
jgi:serine/threonine protein kinase